MNYWSRATHASYTRRRALALAGSSAAMAAILACGSGNDSKSPSAPVDKSGLLVKPEVSTSRAKTGGIWQYYQVSEPTSFDSVDPRGAQTTELVAPAYSYIVQYKPGTVKEPPDGSVQGDAV